MPARVRFWPMIVSSQGVMSAFFAEQTPILEMSETIVDPNQTVTRNRRTDLVRLPALVGNIFYLLEASSNKSLSIGIYFDAELISEVEVNLGTP